MKIAILGMVGAASFVAAADAGFSGFVASVRNSGAYTIIDIFAGVQNASDKFLNVYNLNSDATGGFFQATGLANKTWKPDAASFNSTRSTLDSFMTAGTYSGGAYGGEFYASTNTTGDPNFTGSSWNATPASPAATTIPANAGWYTADPTSVDNNAESLAGLVGRVNGSGGATANFGIWCAHLVVLGNNATIGGASATVRFDAFVSIKDGVTGQTSQASSNFVPAPGALALLGVAGFASRRRRA
jgi:MYXO-CTERM domain-containing protein